MVRYLDHSDYLVKTRCITSKFLGRAKHNLYQYFLSSAEGMCEGKLLQVLLNYASMSLNF